MKLIKYVTRNYSLRDHVLMVQSLYKQNTIIPGFYYTEIVDVFCNGLADIYIGFDDKQNNISRLKKHIDNEKYLEDRIKQGKKAIDNLLDLPYDILETDRDLDNKEIINIIKIVKDKFFNFGAFIEFTHYIDRVGFRINDAQIKTLGDFHNKRKETFLEVFNFLNQLFEKKLKNSKIKNKKLDFILIEEAVDFFNSKIDEQYINEEQKKRMDKCICILKNNQEKIVTDNFNSELAKIEARVEIVDKQGVIRGQAINSGIVQGTIKIITQITDYNTIPEDSIIVTQMTTPEMDIFLKKAKALITDEGGVLCHTAIFAREFNKIAVVGTKFATQVLKDGDMVEVDANQGIVKKL